MKRASRVKGRIVAAAVTASVLSTSGLVLADVAAATQTMSATSAVNVRRGPGTTHGVIGVLAASETVTATGSVSGGWYQIRTSKGLTGWVYQSYLRARSANESAPAAGSAGGAPAASGSATTNASVNVRSGPGTSYAVVGVAAKGAGVPTTGKTSGGWTEIVWSGKARWISTSYLGARSTAPAPVASKPSPAPAPASTGSVKVTVGVLYVRATSSASGAVVDTVTRGATLQTTGVVAGDRLQIVHKGIARWVYRPYTSATAETAPSSVTPAPALGSITTSGIAQLNANGRAVVNHVVANYPKIRTIYGWRASSSYSSDHPNGRAVDIMVANWSRQDMIDYGWQIARDFQNNAGKHKVSYIIWRQQIWNAAYPERGWRAMEDRGGATANHYDHVHVSVKA